MPNREASSKCPPVQNRAEGHPCYCQATEGSPLLLVVDTSALDLLARWIGPARTDGAGFAIGRDDNSTGQGDFAALSVGQLQGMVVDLLVRPRVGPRIAGDRIVFAGELARPLAMRGLTLTVDTVYGDFHVVACGLVDNRVVFVCPGGELRFGLVQLPGAHIRVVGKAHCHPDKA